jgi:hypothetical protein
MSSDGELSSIAKKEWEKRLKVRRTSVADPEPDLDLIRFQLGQQIRIQADQISPDKGKKRYVLLEEVLVGQEACPRFLIQKLFLGVTY